MKIKTDIRRLCDELSEEFYKDLDISPLAEAEEAGEMETGEILAIGPVPTLGPAQAADMTQTTEPASEAGLEILEAAAGRTPAEAPLRAAMTSAEAPPADMTPASAQVKQGQQVQHGRRPDPERIKEITFRKIHGEGEGSEKEIKKPMKRISNKIIIAAALIAVLTTTAFAAGGLDFFRSFFGDSVDQAGDGILQIAASAEDEDFTMTAEQIISDGINTKIIVGLQPESKQARKWLNDPKIRIDIRAESASGNESGVGMTGSEALPQFDTKDKSYFCVSYVSDKDYTGEPITVTLDAVIKGKVIGDEEETVTRPELSLVIEKPTSMNVKKTIEFAREDGDVKDTQPVSLVVNAISAVLTLQEPKGSTGTPTLDVTLVMKDGTKENIFEAGWVEEGAAGGGGMVMGSDHSALPLANGNSYARNLETAQIVQTSSFSRIIDVDSVDYAIVGGERYDFE